MYEKIILLFILLLIVAITIILLEEGGDGHGLDADDHHDAGDEQNKPSTVVENEEAGNDRSDRTDGSCQNCDMFSVASKSKSAKDFECVEYNAAKINFLG